MDIMKKENLWPTPVWYFDIDSLEVDFDKIKNEIYKIKAVDLGKQASNYLGWQSNDLYVDKNTDTETNKLMLLIENQASNCFDDIRAKSSLSRKISNYWLNVNKKNDLNYPHSHPESSLSGCVYIECGENSGNIRFYRNAAETFCYSEILGFENKDSNPYGFEYVYFKPIKYRVLVFPAFLMHMVEPNKADEDRISIAFNFYK